ncbi:AvrD family protein [Krasilnikovia sp. M28-CT-15]|uniref:AvrD family protein n=1 Tax=Krasilnikovia sp. M28-CT-15 TaxID=3373540 RepID=UPI003875D115
MDVPQHGTFQLASLDDRLGPASGRFFGSGYRRAEHLVSWDGIGAGGQTRATASVRYPTDWSRKGGSELRPHLSTVDVLLLGAEAAQMRLLRDGLDADSAWLRRVEIQAGPRAVEDDLAGFEVSADAPTVTGAEIQVPVQVANMRLRLHFTVLAQPSPTLWQDFREHRQHVRDIHVDRHALAATATAGLERDRHVTMIDAFVVALQLGQILLYELDAVDRRTTNTLWMRTTVLEAAAPAPVLTGPVTTSASLEDARVVAMRGGSWRTATISGEFFGVHTSCAVTHELPAERGTE